MKNLCPTLQILLLKVDKVIEEVVLPPQATCSALSISEKGQLAVPLWWTSACGRHAQLETVHNCVFCRAPRSLALPCAL